jgi:hypothetical protein
MGGREDFDNALKATMAARREELGGPPTPEELLAYRDGRLDPAARQSVEARLAAHPDSARTLADLAAFPEVEAAPGTPELSDEDVEVRWQALRQRLGELPAEPPAPRAVPRPRRFPAFRLALAALLLLAVGGAGGFVAGRASHPPRADLAVNAVIAELAPVEEGGTRSMSLVEVPDTSEEVVLILGLPDGRELPQYGVEIEGSKGARIGRRDGLRPTPLGTIHLSFPRSVLPPGVYRIRLFGSDAGGSGAERKSLLAAYELRLAEAPESP